METAIDYLNQVHEDLVDAARRERADLHPVQGRPPRRMPAMGLVAAVVSVLVVAGLIGSGIFGGTEAERGSAVPADGGASTGATGATGGAEAGADEDAATAPAPTPGEIADLSEGGGREAPSADLTRVIRTAEISIVIPRDTFDERFGQAFDAAEASGGFVADSSYADEGGTPRGTFVLRVPAARFGEVLRQVEGLGTVQRRQISGQDVTEEFIDLEARVRNLERQEARLLTFMDRATKIPDLMAIENEVARVRGEIERLTGRLRFLANRVDLATIQAEVSQKPKKAPGGFWDFNRTIARIQAAFLNTVRELLAVAEGLVAFGAAVLPLVLLGALGWGLVRRSLRRADRAA